MTASDSQIAARIRENIARVRENIRAAAARSDRNADQVLLVGVTKYVNPAMARLLFEAGVTDLGESRPQEMWEKAEALADLHPSWHLIGHLQRNKVKRTLPLVTCIHSVDTLRVLQEVNTHAANNPRPVSDVLLEVNVSGDTEKHGFRPDEIEPLLSEINKLGHVAVLGLMTMSGLESNSDQTRREFAVLRELGERLKPKCSQNISMKELSMGMSGDYEIAVEEGATIVRIGSALFEGVKD